MVPFALLQRPFRVVGRLGRRTCADGRVWDRYLICLHPSWCPSTALPRWRFASWGSALGPSSPWQASRGAKKSGKGKWIDSIRLNMSLRMEGVLPFSGKGEAFNGHAVYRIHCCLQLGWCLIIPRHLGDSRHVFLRHPEGNPCPRLDERQVPNRVEAWQEMTGVLLP